MNEKEIRVIKQLLVWNLVITLAFGYYLVALIFYINMSMGINTNVVMVGGLVSAIFGLLTVEFINWRLKKLFN